MKQISQVILSLILCGVFNSAQAQTYHVTVSNEPFVFLENAQTAVDGPWDVPEFQLPIGFDFELFDLTSNQFYSFFNAFGGVFELNLDENHLYMLIPFYASLIDRGYQQDSALSPINYKTVGLAGERVFTIEYKEAGLYEGIEDENNIFIEHISFQLRLYEESGDIEFQFGPYSIQSDPETIFNPFIGPIVGLLKDADWDTPGGYIGEMIFLEGDALQPTVVTDTVAFLDWPIPENTVYRFSRKGASVPNSTSAPKQSFFSPNPSSGVVHLQGNSANDVAYPICVFDVLGNVVCQWNSETEVSQFHFMTGSYFAIIRTKDKVITEKLLVLPE